MSRHRPAPLTLLLLLLVAALAAPAGGAARAADDRQPVRRPQERSAAVGAATSLIVTYRAGTPAGRRDAIRSAEGLERTLAIPNRDAEVVRPRGRSVAALMHTLAGRADVVSVQPNHRRTRAADPTDEAFWEYQWGHHNTGQTIADGARPPTVGKADVDVDGKESLGVLAGSDEVVVAVIDDGVDFGHPDLRGSEWVNPGESGSDGKGGDRAANGVDDDGNGYVDDVNGWDFCNDDNSVHDFDDDFHGTSVAGVIAAQLNEVGVAGIAPATRIMALKFLSDRSPNPECNSDATAILAIEYAKSFGVRIINASWGGPEASPALEAAIAESGALFVAAAGNGGGDGRGDNIDVEPSYPAASAAPNVVSVAAVTNTGQLASFSNYGPRSVDLAAPGQSIALPCPEDSTYPAEWCWMDGTSFSAPYVSGAAALVGAARESLLASPSKLKRRLLDTTVPLTSTTGKTATGGLVNARRAVDFQKPTLASAPGILPYTGSTLGLASIKARLSWPAATDDLAMGSYRVEQRRDGGEWTSLTQATSARFLDFVIGLSGTYEFRVTPRDSAGNLGAPSPVKAVRPMRFEEASSLVGKAGTWRTSSSSSYSGGKTAYTTASGASVTFTFNGRTAALIAPRSATRSSFKVYLDGSLVKTVSLYAGSTQNRVVLYSTGTLAYGSHTVRLVQARVGSRTRADLDAFVVFR